MFEISTSTKQKIMIEHMVDRLPALRKKYGISQTELGEKIGLSRQTISAIERKTTPLTWTTMLAILMFFTANSNCVFYFPQRTEFKDAEIFHSELKIEGSKTEAYSWACKGVEKGDLDCHMLIAWFYEMGNVVDQNYDMAYKYFKIAADNGHEMSAELIKRYRRNIFGNYYLPQ